MTGAQQTLWITGAGRSGTHLIGMLLDGHPQVNVFPREFRLAHQWLDLCGLGTAGDGLALPAGRVDALLQRHYQIRAGSWPAGEAVTFGQTLEEVQRRHYSDSLHRMFAFHSPGSQLDFFFSQLREGARVIITLRHPIQNYLALLAHVLQKGEGYRPAEKLQPEIGLTSMLHLNLFRVFSAFQAACRWASDERVLVTRLEDFTAQIEERQRVWEFLGLAADPILERTTRGGEPSDARSGQWQSSEIVPVSQDAYQEPLTETERRAFESTASWWSPFYPDALIGLIVRPDAEAAEVFYQREANCLLQDRHAQKHREERVAAVFGQPPQWLSGLLRHPRRAIKTFFRERLAYPDALMWPRRGQLKRLQHNLEEVPALVGAVDGGSD